MAAKIVPVMPKLNDEAALHAQVMELLAAADAVGVTLEHQGFLHSWLSDSTRVVTATQDDKTVGFAIMVYGRRWYDTAVTASILLCAGDARHDILKYLVDMARILGAQKLFYEYAEGDPIEGELANLLAVTL